MAVHHSLELGADGFGEAPDGFFPQLDDYNTGPEDYLTLVRQAKKEIDVPVIASLNGTSTGGWTLYARILADEGIDALELNTYQIAASINHGANEIEGGYLHLVETIRGAIEIPLAVKIGPFFSSTANMASRLVDAGADALVIFNRLYQPDIDTRDSRGDSQAGAIGAGGTETRAALAGHPPRPDRVRPRGDHRCS